MGRAYYRRNCRLEFLSESSIRGLELSFSSRFVLVCSRSYLCARMRCARIYISVIPFSTQRIKTWQKANVSFCPILLRISLLAALTMNGRDNEVIADLARLGEGSYYWSLPTEFRGNKLGAYGGLVLIICNLERPGFVLLRPLKPRRKMSVLPPKDLNKPHSRDKGTNHLLNLSIPQYPDDETFSSGIWTPWYSIPLFYQLSYIFCRNLRFTTTFIADSVSQPNEDADVIMFGGSGIQITSRFSGINLDDRRYTAQVNAWCNHRHISYNIYGCTIYFLGDFLYFLWDRIMLKRCGSNFDHHFTVLPWITQIPMDENYWFRADGQAVTHEHMLMALADVQNILIKASFTRNTRQASISDVTMDVADENAPQNNPRAYAVEEVIT